MKLILSTPEPVWIGRVSVVSVKWMRVFAENLGRHDLEIDRASGFGLGKFEIIVGVLTGKLEPYKNWSSASISHGQLLVIEEEIGEVGSSIRVVRRCEVEPRWECESSFEWVISGDVGAIGTVNSSSVSKILPFENLRPDIFGK